MFHQFVRYLPQTNHNEGRKLVRKVDILFLKKKVMAKKGKEKGTVGV